jgi:hypothetical protein
MSAQQAGGVNLDREAARYAQDIVNEAVKLSNVEPKHVDNLVTKALGVLQENGTYACILYLYSRTQAEEKKVAEVVRGKLLDLAEELDDRFNFEWGKADGRDAEPALEYVSDKLCKELDPLLMLRELWEQTLIYARYGAKARQKKEQKE